MIQSSTIGKRRIVTQLEFDNSWDSPDLHKVLRTHSQDVSAPRDYLCKPQSYEVLVECLANSKNLRVLGLTDLAVRLARQLDDDVVKTIYFGFLVGRQSDLNNMEKPDSPETVVYDNRTMPGIYLLMAYLIAQSVLEDLRKVANISLRSVIRSKLKKFISASGHALLTYQTMISQAKNDPLGVIGNRGYDYGDYVIFYVSPVKYEDMVTEIMPSTLIESKKAELEIRKLVTVTTTQSNDSSRGSIRNRERSTRGPSLENHRAA